MEKCKDKHIKTKVSSGVTWGSFISPLCRAGGWARSVVSGLQRRINTEETAILCREQTGQGSQITAKAQRHRCRDLARNCAETLTSKTGRAGQRGLWQGGRSRRKTGIPISDHDGGMSGQTSPFFQPPPRPGLDLESLDFPGFLTKKQRVGRTTPGHSLRPSTPHLWLCRPPAGRESSLGRSHVVLTLP